MVKIEEILTTASLLHPVCSRWLNILFHLHFVFDEQLDSFDKALHSLTIVGLALWVGRWVQVSGEVLGGVSFDGIHSQLVSAVQGFSEVMALHVF